MNSMNLPDSMAMCPRRGWVLSALADDEADDPQAYPRALHLHLAGCPSCRQAADRLLAVTEDLQTLSLGEASESLESEAEYLAFAALRDGRGPVVVCDAGDAMDELLIDHEALRRRRKTWVLRVLAAAAVLLFAVLFGKAWQTALNENRLASKPAPVPFGAPVAAPAEGDAALVGATPNAADPNALTPSDDNDYEGALEGKIDAAQRPMLPQRGAGNAIQPPNKD
ncbi:MAG: hypothetical protein IT449_13835 [Phycisphaerales bacterium]|nr:hypothetical protein [Phycisphaerales bacterium]